jgi:hypothetical protein
MATDEAAKTLGYYAFPSPWPSPAFPIRIPNASRSVPANAVLQPDGLRNQRHLFPAAARVSDGPLPKASPAPKGTLITSNPSASSRCGHLSVIGAWKSCQDLAGKFWQSSLKRVSAQISVRCACMSRAGPLPADLTRG